MLSNFLKTAYFYHFQTIKEHMIKSIEVICVLMIL